MSLQVEPSKHTSESIEDLIKLIKERIISTPKCLFCDHQMDPLGKIDHLNSSPTTIFQFNFPKIKSAYLSDHMEYSDKILKKRKKDEQRFKKGLDSKEIIFQHVTSIFYILREKSFKWQDLKRNPHMLVLYQFFNELKDYYHTLVLLKKSSFFEQQVSAFKAVIKVGRLDIFEYLWSRCIPVDLENTDKTIKQRVLEIQFASTIRNNLQSFVVEGAVHNRMDIVKFLLDTTGYQGKLNDAFIASPKSGNLEMVKLLSARSEQSKHSSKVFDNAAAAGNLQVIEWLVANRPKKELKESDMYKGAIIGGHIDIVRYLLSNESIHRSVSAPYYALAANNVEIMKLLHQHNFESHGVTPHKAIANNNLEMLIWIKENKTDAMFPDCLIEMAIENSNLEIVRWLTENTTTMATKRAMDLAAKLNNLEMLKYLHFNRSEGCSKMAMDHACELGHFNILEWLHQNRSEGCTTYAMNNSAKNGHLQILQFLHVNRTEGLTHRAMSNATDLEVIKFLHFNTNEHESVQEPLDAAIKNGNLDIIIWLCENIIERCSTPTLEKVMKSNYSHIIEWFTLNRPEFNIYRTTYTDNL
ncbi:hypothetical protein PPL_03242 [Heterostelium album PN500]|uniref:Ankyrin repeat protein n=1 Tax=Heterostelium pallidum (strain ATCC 26659 / Pp 5 / PN500) TaxID=670386 RepID=D3B4C0_HETP5|nr:hypothetical protein PPL_03242 [Heterostelium album PN500]EFA84168.1 hypothetical protein PPL_03242 [Heterostelium album PN500]|eukprot:XP_020436285.1 hypothetical protein PPL_03242 [Heterostelium album PN500]